MPRIRRHRELKVNMGDYESYTFGADVTLSHHDFGVTDDALAEMKDDEREELQEEITVAVLHMINDQLKTEVADATHLTNYQRSFLLNGLDDRRSSSRPRRRN